MTISSCPRCGHRLAPIPQPSRHGSGGHDLLDGARLGTLVLWPGLPLLILCAFAPASALLSYAGPEARVAAVVAALALALAGAVIAALLERQRRRPGPAPDAGASLRFCPWCECTVAPVRSRR